MIFSLFGYFRSEHKKHSPKCAFLSLTKPTTELTVGELINLECERINNKMVSNVTGAAYKSFMDNSL